MTAVAPAGSSAPAPARGAAAPDAAASDGPTVAFAGLILSDSAASAPAVEAGQRDAAGDTANDTTRDTGAEEDSAAESPPSLLGWLFGLMASTGRAAPTGAGATAAATAEAMPAGAPAALPQSLAAHAAAAPAVTADIAAAADAADVADPRAAIDAQAAGLVPAMQRATAADSAGIPALPATAAPDAASASEAQAARDPVSSLTTEAVRLVPTLLHDLHATLHADRPASAAPNAPLNALAATFADDIGERIEWQLADGLSEASIELHPAELGAITVRVEVHGDQARVLMIAAEAATRALLTQAMPQLRELLSGSGLNLSRGHVEPDARGSGRSHARDGDVRIDGSVRRRVTEVLLLDAYA